MNNSNTYIDRLVNASKRLWGIYSPDMNEEDAQRLMIEPFFDMASIGHHRETAVSYRLADRLVIPDATYFWKRSDGEFQPCLVCEFKAVHVKLTEAHIDQLRKEMEATGAPFGVLSNFTRNMLFVRAADSDFDALLVLEFELPLEDDAETVACILEFLKRGEYDDMRTPHIGRAFAKLAAAGSVTEDEEPRPRAVPNPDDEIPDARIKTTILNGKIIKHRRYRALFAEGWADLAHKCSDDRIDAIAASDEMRNKHGGSWFGRIGGPVLPARNTDPLPCAQGEPRVFVPNGYINYKRIATILNNARGQAGLHELQFSPDPSDRAGS